ncbi:MAG: CHAT domain-containing protein [Rhodospirillales bacterium]|nr:CHAT domain-containing protein [Rhodospirillales bacterium]
MIRRYLARCGTIASLLFALMVTWSAAHAVELPRAISAAIDVAGEHFSAKQYELAAQSYEKALLLGEETWGKDFAALAPILDALGRTFEKMFRTVDAENAYRRAFPLWEKLRGPDHPDVADSLMRLGGIERDKGNFAAAEPLFRRALAIREKALEPDDFNIANALNSLGSTLVDLAKYEEPEALFRRALAIVEKTSGPDHTDVSTILEQLALLYAEQGRKADAEQLLLRSLNISTKHGETDPEGLARTYNAAAGMFVDIGDYDRALNAMRKSLGILEKELGPDHPKVATAVANLGLVYDGLEFFTIAEALYEQALEIERKYYDENHPRFLVSQENLASLYVEMGRYDEAEKLFGKVLDARVKIYGDVHPILISSLSNFAYMYADYGMLDEALSLIELATTIAILRAGEAADPSSEATRLELESLGGNFVLHARIAAELAKWNMIQKERAIEGAFGASQLGINTAAATAAARTVARFATGNTTLAATVRDRQNAARRRDEIDAELRKAAAQMPEKRDEAALQGLREEFNGLQKVLDETDIKLATEFPLFSNLMRPLPVKVKEVQRLLGADEALLLWLVGRKEVYLFAIRKEETGLIHIDITKDELEQAVSALRTSIVPSATDEQLPAFDLNGAHDLYKTIFAPADEILSGANHLITVLDGPLQSLPLGVLLDGPPTDAATRQGYENEPWLTRKYAISVHPSVSSFAMMRSLDIMAPAPNPFTGIGDPILSGHPGDRRGIPVFSAFTTSEVDLDALRSMPPLPETADELRAIAQSLGVGNDALILGKRATESRVMATDLSQSRVIAFATHALVAGEISGVSEPALVLTPPAGRKKGDDGLLTASEIARDLKLNADWVILSACNTAAGDKPGAEGLSGLAKAFLFAGARALMVSHWPVDSTAATQLTTGAFRAMEEDPLVSRAEALRQSMVGLMTDLSVADYSHPYFWAPFIVVGEGGTNR